MLQLNEHQVREVSRLERDSFAELCHRIGSDPIEHEQLVLANAKMNLRELISVHGRPEIAKVHLE